MYIYIFVLLCVVHFYVPSSESSGSFSSTRRRLPESKFDEKIKPVEPSGVSRFVGGTALLDIISKVWMCLCRWFRFEPQRRPTNLPRPTRTSNTATLCTVRSHVPTAQGWIYHQK